MHANSCSFSQPPAYFYIYKNAKNYMKNNTKGVLSFQNFTPDRVVELCDERAYSYLCHEGDLPQDDKDFFTLLHEVRENAMEALKRGKEQGNG